MGDKKTTCETCGELGTGAAAFNRGYARGRREAFEEVRKEQRPLGMGGYLRTICGECSLPLMSSPEPDGEALRVEPCSACADKAYADRAFNASTLYGETRAADHGSGDWAAKRHDHDPHACYPNCKDHPATNESARSVVKDTFTDLGGAKLDGFTLELRIRKDSE